MNYKDLAEEAIVLHRRSIARRTAEIDRWEAWIEEHYAADLTADELLILKQLVSTGRLGEAPLLRALAETRDHLPEPDPTHGRSCVCHLRQALGDNLLSAVKRLRDLGLISIVKIGGVGVVEINPEIQQRVADEHPLTPTPKRLEHLFFIANTLRRRSADQKQQTPHVHNFVPIEELFRKVLSGVQDADVADIHGYDSLECDHCDHDHGED